MFIIFNVCAIIDCYTSYSWNLKKPSHYQLQEAEAAHWRAVHASNQDLSLLEEEQGQKEKNDEADQQALLELFHSTQQLSKEPTFTTINSNSTSESFDNADSFYSIRSMRSPTNRVLLEPLTPANLEALCERKITDDSDRPRTHMTTPPSETTIKLQNRPFNPQSLAFRSDSPSVNSKIPAEQSSYSGHFERSTASVRMAPIKSVKRDLPADTSTKSDGGYFRKLLSKFV